MSDGVLDKMEEAQTITLASVAQIKNAMDDIRAARDLVYKMRICFARSQPDYKQHMAVEDLLSNALSKLGE